jgi:AsmA protein
MKRLLIGIAALVFGLLVLGVGGLLLVDANHFRPQIQATLSQSLGREVTLGKLHVVVWSGSLDADDIQIGEEPAFGTQPFVSAKSLELGVQLWPLLIHRQLRITSLTLDQPSVRLLQDSAGRWNFASFGGAGREPGSAATTPADAAAQFSVDKLRINDGSIELKRASGDIRRYRKLQLSADHVGMAAAFPFAMRAAMAGGGTLDLEGKLGPWNAGDAALTPVDAHLVMHQLDLVGAGLVSSGEGIGGRLDVDTQIRSSQGLLQSKGRITANQLKLVASGSPAPQPIEIDYQAGYQLGARTGRIDRTTLGSGGAKLSVNGSFDNRPKVMQLNLQIAGRQLPVDQLQSLLPAFGVVLPSNSHLSGGTLGVNLRAQGPLDGLVISGPVTLDQTRLAGYSLGSKLGGALSLAGIKAPKDTVIRHAEATLRIAPSGINADPLSAEIADLGSLTGKGRMAADGKLDFRMLVKLDQTITGAGQSGQGIGSLLGGSKAGRLLGGVVGATSDQGVGIRVSGTASAPSFKLDPTAVTGLLKAGLGSAVNKGSAPGIDAGKPSQPVSRKDVLKTLLRGVLKPKKDDSGSGH